VAKGATIHQRNSDGLLTMSPETAQKILQREVGDPALRVRWRNDIERFEVGRKVDGLLSNHIEWFYTVTDGESGFRPVDQRTVRKLISLDTWRRSKTLTYKDFLGQIQEKKLEEHEEKREAMKYRFKHSARYIKRAAEKDGVI
jgi:hypothetical protein